MIVRSKGQKIFNGVNIAILTLFGLFCLIPFLMIFSASLTGEGEFLAHGYALFPRGFTFDAYVRLFADDITIVRAIGNSLFYTVAGTLLHTFVTALSAYPLSKKNFVGGGIFMRLILFAMLFSGGLIPTYILVVNMGLKNNWLALLLPGMLAPWTCFLIRNFYYSIPQSLEEAVKIDGGNNWVVFTRIYLPLSMSFLSTAVLTNAVAFWNAWSGPILYFDNAHRYMLPLTAVLQQLLQENISSSGSAIGGYTEPMKMATVVISVVPILIVFPIIQKYMINGMMYGAVKE